MAGEIKDIQISSKLNKDVGAAAVGYFTFAANMQALDQISIGGRTVGFNQPAADINVTIGGSLDASLDATVTAINGDATIGVHAIKGVNSATLNLVAKVAGTAGNLALAIDTDGGGNFVVSAANMADGKDEAITEVFSSSYVITATDVAELAAGARNAEIAVACIPKTTAPLNWTITVYDDSGDTFLAPTNLKFVWRQVGSDFYGLFLEDDGPILAANDTINVVAYY